MINKEEVKETIVDVARQIFSKFGFKKTTMNEIANAKGKGKSSIYYYFASKEKIFQAVVEKEASILNQELLKANRDADSPTMKLKMHVLVRMHAVEKLANYYSAIKDEYLSHLDFIEKIRKKSDLEEIQMMENILIEGVADGIFDIKDISLAAIAIVTALKGMEVPLFWGGEEKNIDQRLDNLIHILFNGVMTR
jgi:AcrR family transcriptional regulator